MLEVHNIQVLSWTLNALDISWEIRPTYEDTADYDFYVLRSESAAGPFQVLNSKAPIVPPTAFLFRDGQQPVYSKIRQFRYRIRVVQRGTGDAVEFGSRTRDERSRGDQAIGSVGVEALPDKVLLAINRRFEMLLEKKVGRRVLLLSRMTFGRHCACYDVELRKILLPDCRTCFGVGFTGGYYSPIAIYAKISPVPRGVRRTPELGEVHPSQSMLELGRFPPVKTGDLLVERENRRWHVGQVTTTEKRRAASRQVAAISELEKAKIEYQVPVSFPAGYDFVPTLGLRPRMDPTAQTSDSAILQSGG